MPPKELYFTTTRSMTDFIAFARAYGVLISSMPPLGVWRRFPTESKPHHRNGAIKWMGDYGFVCDWATGGEVHVWKSDAEVRIDHDKIRRLAQEAERKRLQQQEEAAKKAQAILAKCNYGYHPYLVSKGFPEEQGNIWKSDDGLILVIPMRVGHRLVGCQLIREDGSKKFLAGQRTSNAELVLDGFTKGIDVLVEGYATGLAVRKAMKKINNNCRIHITFSAGNMFKVAETLPMGFIVADHDASMTGEKTAQKTGWPYFLPPDVGFDFNDHFMKYGLVKAEGDLRKKLLEFTREGKIKPFR